jgi:hypothetical protein
MLPFFRSSWVFRSRWMALLWAAGFCWFALDFSGAIRTDSADNVSDQEQGGAFTKADVEKVAATLNSL